MTDNLPVFIADIDNKGRLQYANETGRVWYNKPGFDGTGYDLKDLLDPDLDAFEPYMEAALRGETVRFERVVQYPDGKTWTVDITHLPHIASDGTVLGYFSQTVDPTNVK